MNIFIGTDPGTKGGIVAINERGKIIDSLRLSKSTIQEIARFYGGHSDAQISILERVHSMPGQGVSSTFKFGKATGILLMGMASADIRHEEVTPRSWQKFLKIKKKQKTESKTDFKRRLKEEAQRLFPDQYIVNENADAYLIAEYARRKYGNIFTE